MKKAFFLFMIVAMALTGVAAYAVVAPPTMTYTFTPSDADLADLPHEYFYTWGIKWVLPSDEIITGATLTYHNIYDWTTESNDRLYTHLLNTVSDPNGTSSPNYVSVVKPTYSYKTITIQTYDNQGGGDNFAPENVAMGNKWLGTWTDPIGGYARGIDVSYAIPVAQLAWLADGNFGFGIDPDCHYYNCGVSFKIITDKIPTPGPTVPEPMSIMLGIMGLGSVVGLKRLRR